MLQFVLVRPENTVVVDNADTTTVDCSALPANVDVVSYVEIEGRIEYNDRPAVREVFTNPAPYQPLINAWMTALPGLTLTLAKAVKKDLVDGIYHHKRRLPFAYGPWLYDARDEAVTYDTLLLDNTKTVSSTGIIDAINNAIATIVSRINTMIVSVYNTTVNEFGLGVTQNCLHRCNITGGVQFYRDNHTSAYSNGLMAGTFQSPTPNFQIPAGWYRQMSNVATVMIGASTSTITYSGTITMMPLNAPAPQAVAASDLYTILVSIASRRNSLNNDRLSKRVAIDALTTIPAIAAYDAAAGWSF